MREVKFGVGLPFYPFELTLELALRAEEAGLDSIWIPDHLVGTRTREALDVWSLLSALSMKTSRVRLATGVTDPHRRHVAVLAQTATTVDILSRGRLILGIGAGEAMNLAPYGIDFAKPVAKLRETLLLLKRLWTEDTVDAEGRFYRLKGASVRPKPVQRPHPPLWVAASSPLSLGVVGELGDGWLPFQVTVEGYREALARITEAAKSAGRSLDSLEPSLYVFASLDEERERAARVGALPAKVYLAMMPRRLEALGFGEYARHDLDLLRHVYTPESTKILLEAAERIPQEAAELVSILGTPEEGIARIERFVEAGARHVIIFPLGDAEAVKRTLHHYAATVVPCFRGAR